MVGSLPAAGKKNLSPSSTPAEPSCPYPSRKYQYYCLPLCPQCLATMPGWHTEVLSKYLLKEGLEEEALHLYLEVHPHPYNPVLAWGLRDEEDLKSLEFTQGERAH